MPSTSSADSQPTPSPRQVAVLTVARELEQHVASGGWDGPIRLFALVNTAAALSQNPELASQLPQDVVEAAHADAEHLTAVEQEDLPDADTIEALLAQIQWPPTVDGAALVVERLILPPDVESLVPSDPLAAKEFAASHPQRRELRLVAAALRDGTAGCAIRARDHDEDTSVAVGPDLVPQLVAALLETLRSS